MAWDIECILQECLNNAGKHSGAKEIKVNLSRGNGSILLEVADNGKGIGGLDVSKLSGDHLGLKGIIDRATKLNGDVDITSKDKGTKIVVCIPLT